MRTAPWKILLLVLTCQLAAHAAHQQAQRQCPREPIPDNFRHEHHETATDLADSVLKLRSELDSQATTIAFFQAILAPASHGIPWNTVVPHGYIVDSRDGKVYRTVRIGTQVWMAQNLNYTNSDSTLGVCDTTDLPSCDRYGRLYTWTELMNGSHQAVPGDRSGAQGICPPGWHVPTDSEWNVLVSFAGEVGSAANRLKSTGGWGTGANGTDEFGFRALPAGFYNLPRFLDVGTDAFFWTSSLDTRYRPYPDTDPRGYMYWGLARNSYTDHQTYPAWMNLSARCLLNQ